jgi:hypothetical protein
MIRRLDLPVIEPADPVAPVTPEPEISSPWWARAAQPAAAETAAAEIEGDDHTQVTVDGDQPSHPTPGDHDETPDGDETPCVDQSARRDERRSADRRTGQVSTSRRRTHDALQTAQRDGQPRCFTVGPVPFTIAGVVVAVGRRWVLVARLHDELFWDGYTVMRRDDITVMRAADAISTRWAQRHRHGVDDVSAIDLDSTGKLIATIHDATPLVQVHLATNNPPSLFIGRVDKARDKSISIHCVDTDGHWAPGEPVVMRRSAMSHMVFGANYDRAIRELCDSDEPPSADNAHLVGNETDGAD